jgi:Spy/CpxP family protein refolding chaperone
VSPKRLALSAAGALLAALAFSPASAQREGPPGPGHHRMGSEARLEKTLEEKLRAAREELRKLLDQDAPDEIAVLAEADRMGAIRTEMQRAMLRTLLAVRAELTAEQRKQLGEKMRERRFRMRRGEPPPDDAS